MRFVRLGRASVAIVGGSFLLTGVAIARFLAGAARAHGSPCGSGTAAVLSASLLSSSGDQKAPSAGPSKGGPPLRTSASPSLSQSPAQPESPSPSGGSPSSASPSPSSRSPSPSPSGSHSPSPSPSPSRSRRPGALCATAQLVPNQSSARPGGTVTYSVWIWSTVAAQRVVANVAASGQLTRAPRFTLCPVV